MSTLDRKLTYSVAVTLVLTASAAWSGQDESLTDSRADELLRRLQALRALLRAAPVVPAHGVGGAVVVLLDPA